MSDVDIIAQAVANYSQGDQISDGQARVIAAGWIAPNCPGLTAFATSGAILDSLEGEITAEIRHIPDPEVVAELLALRAYVEARSVRGPVDGWSNLWG